MGIITKEFMGNVLVTISEKEVRLWVCNEKGQNIFRFKTIGKVYNSGSDVMVMGPTEMNTDKNIVHDIEEEISEYEDAINNGEQPEDAASFGWNIGGLKRALEIIDKYTNK